MKLGNADVLIRYNNRNTTCFVNVGNKVSTGIAQCSIKDNFSRKIGRKIALKRALDDSGMSKDERKEVWTDYLNTLKV